MRYWPAACRPTCRSPIVNNATTPQQRVFVTTLAHAGVDAAAQAFGAPSIIAIGEMVRLREALSPFAITLAAESR